MAGRANHLALKYLKIIPMPPKSLRLIRREDIGTMRKDIAAANAGATTPSRPKELPNYGSAPAFQVKQPVDFVEEKKAVIDAPFKKEQDIGGVPVLGKFGRQTEKMRIEQEMRKFSGTQLDQKSIEDGGESRMEEVRLELEQKEKVKAEERRQREAELSDLSKGKEPQEDVQIGEEKEREEIKNQKEQSEEMMKNEERKKLERIEAEKKEAEVERIKIEEERRKIEEEKRKLEEEKRRAEEEIRKEKEKIEAGNKMKADEDERKERERQIMRELDIKEEEEEKIRGLKERSESDKMDIEREKTRSIREGLKKEEERKRREEELARKNQLPENRKKFLLLEKKKLESEIDSVGKEIRRIIGLKRPLEAPKTALLKETEGIQKAAKVIFEREKKIEEEAAALEAKEASATTSKEKKQVEKERWLLEDKRRDLEMRRWPWEEKIKEINEKIAVVDSKYSSLDEEKEILEMKEKDIAGKLHLIDIELEKFDLLDRILKVEEIKKILEDDKRSLFDKLDDVDDKLEVVIKTEMKAEEDKKLIEEEEKLAKDIEQRKRRERERWEAEEKRRKIESERWKLEEEKENIDNQLKKIEDKFVNLSDKNNSIVNRIKEIDDKLGSETEGIELPKEPPLLAPEEPLIKKEKVKEIKKPVPSIPPAEKITAEAKKEPPAPELAKEKPESDFKKPEQEKAGQKPEGSIEKKIPEPKKISEANPPEDDNKEFLSGNLEPEKKEQASPKAKEEQEANGDEKKSVEEAMKRIEELRKKMGGSNGTVPLSASEGEPYREPIKEAEDKNENEVIRRDISDRIKQSPKSEDNITVSMGVDIKEEKPKKSGFFGQGGEKKSKGRSAFNRAPQQFSGMHELPAKPSGREKLWVRVLIFGVVLVFLSAVVTFWYWYLVIRNTPPPASVECTSDADCAGEQICTDGKCGAKAALACTSDTNCASGQYCESGTCADKAKTVEVPPALFSVEDTRVLEVKNNSEIKSLLGQVVSEFQEPGLFKRVAIIDTTSNLPVSLRDILDSLQVRVPSDFYQKIGNDYTLFIYSQATGNRVGFVADVADKEQLVDLMSKEEETMKDDFIPVIAMLKSASPSIVSYFRNTSDISGYAGANFRFLTINKEDVGLCYLISDDRFAFTTSLESMKNLIVKLGIEMPTMSLTGDLKLGSKGDEVKLLQMWLASDATIYQGTASGTFNKATETAVKKFQEKYAADILAPQGLDKSTGIVDFYTRTKLNELYERSGIRPKIVELTTGLKYGDTGEEVKLLQTYLAKDPEVYPQGIANGVFGPLTRNAVTRFQEKYKDDILTPQGLTKGTGIVDASTRKKLNDLYGKK